MIRPYLCTHMKKSSSKYAQCLYFMSQALARKVDRLASQTWKSVNLAPSHAYLLMDVLEEPGIQPGTLAKHLQLQPSTITRFIEKLETKKLLVRTTVGKATNVYPTPKARELSPKLKHCLTHFCQRYSEMLGREESTKLIHDMAKTAERLDE